MDGKGVDGDVVGKEEGVNVVGATDGSGVVGLTVGGLVSASVGSKEISMDGICDGSDVGEFETKVGKLDARRVGGDVSSVG